MNLDVIIAKATRRLSRSLKLPGPTALFWRRVVQTEATAWQAALAAGAQGPRVLVATSLGGNPQVNDLESLLAVSLTLRGANVHVLFCDGLLPACQAAEVQYFPAEEEFVDRGPQKLCGVCFPPGYGLYQTLGLTTHRYSRYVSEKERRLAENISKSVSLADIAAFQFEGLAVGEHAFAGALRYYARGDFEGEPRAASVLRRYLRAALLTALAMRRLDERFSFAHALANHGIYVPHGVIGEVCRQRGVGVVNWNVAYRRSCFVFSHRDTYHHTLLTEPTASWENIMWTDSLDALTLTYLKSRWQGTEDWVRFHQDPQQELSAIAREIGVDFSRPCVGMLTNVIWDAQLHYKANAFPSMLDWIRETIVYFARRPDLQLIIRVHPAEVTSALPSRQRLVDQIEQSFPQLPKNIFIVPPESRVSTYAAMMQCNAVLIYGTKTGVELTSMGIPVIVAGEAWIRGKGVTMDASSRTHYIELLDRLPLSSRLDAETTRRARKYAFHFFFRRMIPVPYIRPTKTGIPPSKLTFSSLQDLLPGKCPGLDTICDGILSGRSFVYPAELLEERSGEPAV